MSYCLVPITSSELLCLVGQDFVAKFQKEIDPVIWPLRRHIALGRPASMGKELWEYAVADSITGGVWCGAGKGIVDVSIGGDVGIDVKSVQIGKHTTTEASMYQPLASQAEASIDFSNRNKQALWNLFVNGWVKKVSGIKEYYMLTIFRNHNFDCSMAGFRVHNIDMEFREESCEFTKKSMKINSIIDPQLANIKAYLSKTRLEIRVTDKVFNDPNYTIKIYQF